MSTGINKYQYILIFLLARLCAGEESAPPNIVFLFADDAGYADFGFQGSANFDTPNLDRLAEQSVRFTQAYTTAAVCGPSRAGLMTGRYQQRFGVEENNVPSAMSPAGLTGAEMGLPLDQHTIADYLKNAGYHSIYLGKWHLGGADRYHPLKRGFDEFYGFRGGARHYFPYESPPKDSLRRLERGFRNFQEHKGYLTDVIADEAIASIERNKNNPFFLFVSFNAVHTPMHYLDADLPDEKIRLKEKRRQLYGMTKAMDRACGRILEKLDELGLTGNTLIVFSNDNGGAWSNNSSNHPLSGVKGTHLEGGIRVPFLLRYGHRFEKNSYFDHPISTLDLLPTFVDVAGRDVKELENVDGVSLIPYLNGKINYSPHKTLYWKKETRSAIRDGDWKLIRLPDRPALLFNIGNDPVEVNDLANKHPEKVKTLYKKLFDWEVTLKRSLWVTKRKNSKNAMETFDKYR
ncbi:MAG: sulfatase-like hydrolase/transferase [Candidatus Marinimicrobia bacterium]|nr:sulfatase-like hydrolase/transferase [Candidatus Neomarinimicrobiota bacterium]